MNPEPRAAHFIGIGGIGMSALARMLLQQGWQVTGSDLRPSEITAGLASRGVRIYAGHSADNIGTPNLVVYTSAVKEGNPELKAALERGLKTVKRAELLGELMAAKRGIAIAGTHGKTTTTALTGLVLAKAGLDPTVFVGGEVPELGGNYREGSSGILIAEADEFDGSFLQLKPEIAVVTNVEPEHLDFYGSFDLVVQAFQRFMDGTTGAVVYCADDPVLARYAVSTQVRQPISYGFHADARWHADLLRGNDAGGTDFLARLDGAPYGEFSLRIPGRHNVANSLAAIAVGYLEGVPQETIQEALAEFGGVNRRFQVLGTSTGVTVIDDYAHHPTEVRATLAAARQRYPDRLIQCLFQPHTYSRTRTLMHLFEHAFDDADNVWITDIYPAREENLWDVSGEELVRNVQHPSVRFVGNLQRALTQVLREAEPGILLLLGAGDIYHLGPQLLDRMGEC